MILNNSDSDVIRFGRAIEAAVIDKMKEARGPTVMYFDADVVIGAIHPLREIRDFVGRSSSRKQASNDWLRYALLHWDPTNNLRFVIRALWSAGYCCRAHMLWSHLCELESEKHAEAKDPSPSDIRLALQATPLERLGAIISSAEQSTTNAIDYNSLLNQLQTVLGLREFVILEAAILNTWQARRAYISESLNVDDDHGMRPSLLVHQPEVFALSRKILRLHQASLNQWERVVRFFSPSEESAQRKDRNAVADAVALSALSKLCSHLRETHAPRRVRLYTQTQAVNQACESPWWRDATKDYHVHEDDEILGYALIDGSPKYSVLDDPNGPLRSSQYMFIRTVIPAVAFSDRVRPLPYTDYTTWTINDLVDVCNRIKQARGNQPMPSGERQALRGIGGSLTGIMTEAAMVSAFKRIWFDVRNPVIVQAVNAVNITQNSLASLHDWSDFVHEHANAAVKALDIQEKIIHEDKLRMDSWAEQLHGLWQGEAWLEVRKDDSIDILQDSGIGRWLFWMSNDDQLRQCATAFRRMLGIDLEMEPVSTAGAAMYNEKEQGDPALMAITNALGSLTPFLQQVEMPRRDRWSSLSMRILAQKALLTSEPNDVSLMRIWTTIDAMRQECRVTAGDQDESGACGAMAAVAWMVFYWIHESMEYRYKTMIPPEAPDLDIRHARAVGLECVGQARNGMDPIVRRLSLVDAVEMLLLAAPGDHNTLETKIAKPPADVDWYRNKYYADAKIWATFTREHVTRKPLSASDKPILRDLARHELDALRKMTQLSVEKYWDDHVLWMQHVGKERQEPNGLEKPSDEPSQ